MRISLNWGPIQWANAIGSDDPKTAPEIYLNGPLRLAPIEEEVQIVSATQVEDRIELRLTAVVGTASPGGSPFSFITFDPFPADLNPVSEIQFLDDSLNPVDEPLVVRLIHRSCGCQFFATIDAQLIKSRHANVRLAFDRLTPVPVAAYTFPREIDFQRALPT